MKEKTVFYCTSCGNETMKWQGRCPACGQWNTIVEHKAAPKPKGVSRAAASTGGVRRNARPLMELDTTDEVRFSTGMVELDRVLGGGAVRGSLVLVGGAPGIGKSTLLLQLCDYVSKSLKVLYVSGEESETQLKMRAVRLGVSGDGLYVLSETSMEDILETGDGSSAAEKEIREKFAAALTAGFLDYEYSGDLLQWGRRSAEEIVTGSFLELEESWRERHWYLSPEGFHMLFDVYQIGPYAAGNINVTVPWEKLSGIIKSEYMPDNLERLAAQGAPELLSYSNLGDKNKYDAEEHIYGDLSRSFWVGFTDAAAYEVKMECGNRMVFYANRMTPHDAVCLNDAEPETASPLDGGTVTYLWRQEGAADAQRVTVGFGKNE